MITKKEMRPISHLPICRFDIKRKVTNIHCQVRNKLSIQNTSALYPNSRKNFQLPQVQPQKKILVDINQKKTDFLT